MSDPIQTVREALKSDSVRFYTEPEALAALDRIEAVVKAAREMARLVPKWYGVPGSPVNQMLDALAALDSQEEGT